jgi:hypothetical protein
MIFALLLIQDLHRLPLEVSDERRSIQSAVHLADETSVAHLVTAFNKEDISVEVKQNKVFIKLLKPVEGSIDCIGASGQLYRIHVIPAKQSVPLLTLRAPAKAAPPPELPAPLTLMRCMRLGQVQDGMDLKRSTAVLIEDPSFVIQLQWVYRWDDLTGFVCTVRNRTARVMRLDPSRFHAPGILLVGARDLKLDAGQVTRLYVVVENE